MVAWDALIDVAGKLMEPAGMAPERCGSVRFPTTNRCAFCAREP